MTLLDTHVILWWQAVDDRLSARARREIERAERILISPVSLWEIVLLVDKGRVRLDRDIFVWTQDFLAGERVELAELTPTAAVAAGLLPGLGFVGDPADAMLYATARERGVPLISKDTRIRSFAAARRDLRAIW
ncbi:MAG: protein domain-containing protein [Chloroflexi bacterium CSP1-4]|nr:MAG: protein domain-containing protein [Chloroflexi bacterium CSP1-4]